MGVARLAERPPDRPLMPRNQDWAVCFGVENWDPAECITTELVSPSAFGAGEGVEWALGLTTGVVVPWEGPPGVCIVVSMSAVTCVV